MNSVVEKIKEWLPNCVTEFKSKDGKIKLGLNFKILKQEFSDVLIELVRTDKINVVYVLNLLKEINHENKEEMQKKVDLILRDIDRSDNEKMRYKSEIMKSFINSRFFDLEPEEDIVKEYEQYEKEVMERNVTKFAEAHGITPNLVFSILNEYFLDERSITKDKIRVRLSSMQLPLLNQIMLINAILAFIKDMYDTFTAEGV